MLLSYAIVPIYIQCTVYYKGFLSAAAQHQPADAENNEPQDRSDTEIVGRLLGQLVYKYKQQAH